MAAQGKKKGRRQAYIGMIESPHSPTRLLWSWRIIWRNIYERASIVVQMHVKTLFPTIWVNVTLPCCLTKQTRHECLMRNGGEVLQIFNFSNRWNWVVRLSFRAVFFFKKKTLDIHLVGPWIGSSSACWDAADNRKFLASVRSLIPISVSSSRILVTHYTNWFIVAKKSMVNGSHNVP
jgi:hypothetical protein